MSRFNLFFFLLLFAISSFSQTAKMSIAGNPKLSSDERVGMRDVNGRVCAAIQVISDMDGFKYQSYNGVVKVDDNPGQDIVYLSPDERVLEIFKSGYVPLKIILSEIGIQLQSQQVWKITITGEAKIGDLLPVTIMMQPKDAIITIDGKNYPSGSAIKLSKGKHKLLLAKQGYKSKEESIEVSENSVYFNYTLKEVDLEQVVIKSVPAEARIFLDNVDKGLTDKGLFLYPGQYRLKLTKTGYLEVNENIDVVTGGSNKFSYTLSKNSGSLSLRITPTGAKVLINKEDYSNRSSAELAPGRYKIEISESGYYPQSETVTIERGKSLAKTYNLSAKTGKLQFNVQPLSAKVTLKQNGHTVQSWTGMKYIKDLQVGAYDLECGASGYGNENHRLTISEGKTEIVEIKLKKGVTAGSASETGTVTDIDGNVYKTVKIGNKVWMAENLKVTHYRNGEAIKNITNATGWSNLSSGAYCEYNNNSANVATYGRLYNWYAVNDSRGIAPAGWHVPTDEEWKELEIYLGMSQTDAGSTGFRGTDEGDKLKSTSGWNYGGNGTNTSGFSAVPGGYRYYYGAFYYMGGYAYFWSSTEGSSSTAWPRILYYLYSDVYRYDYDRRSGFSIRCVRD